MTRIILLFAASLFMISAHAKLVIPIHAVAKDGKGAMLGTVTAIDTQYGLLLTPSLHGLPPGPHGFHVHENPSCNNEGLAAGGHLDPKKTNKHLGPYSDEGHLGDLPLFIVNQDGKATTPILAPRLKEIDLANHSLMIHEGGDNYSDIPVKLGGGGKRLACGAMPIIWNK